MINSRQNRNFWHMYSTIKLIPAIYKEFLVIITGWLTLLKNEPKIRKKFFTGLINVEGNKANSLVFLELNKKNVIFCLSNWRALSIKFTCNEGDPSSVPGLGRSAGEGIGYPLQYSGPENSMDYL